MDTTDALVEQQVRHAELRLRHVDELMVRARATPRTAEPDAHLARLDAQRDALAQALLRLKQGLHPHPRAAASAGHGLIGGLESLGQEIERVLTTVATR